ncbi:MAG: GNAT family N-acetyltransferase [Chloroflexi bacterium]|nr:GNAT family N-acetyltransferase [Chloroflexota bacterium]
MPFPLTTKRLIIRRFQDSDLESFLAYRNDPEVAKYQGWSLPYARENALAFLQEMKAIQLGEPGMSCQVAIELKATGEMIGDIGFMALQNDPRQVRVGYSLARAFWNQRYASEAVARMIDYFFGELHLHRVAADCDPENTASFLLLERLGFRREAHFIESYPLGDGRWGDEYYYGLLEREWMK